MKKLFAALLILTYVFMPSAARSEQEYDPQHTMLALNMAIVSVHKILTAQDRAVLEQEYNNIINNLSLGNIESGSRSRTFRSTIQARSMLRIWRRCERRLVEGLLLV